MGWVASRCGGVHQALRGGELALGVDDLCALFALGLGLLGHGAQHGLGQIHLLDLDADDLHPPGRGVPSRMVWMRELRASRWLSNWSSSTSPRTERSVVWANCEVW